MELSLFLAKLLGLYFLIVAGIWLLRKSEFDDAIRDITNSRSLIAFSGVVALVAGLAIIIGHPVWEWSWRVAITLIGWVMMFQGILRLAFTSDVQRFGREHLHALRWYLIGFASLLGLYLTYHGFAGS